MYTSKMYTTSHQREFQYTPGSCNPVFWVGVWVDDYNVTVGTKYQSKDLPLQDLIG